MKKRTLIFAAAALAAGLTACAPKAGETQPPATIEETQEMTQEPARMTVMSRRHRSRAVRKTVRHQMAEQARRLRARMNCWERFIRL